MTKEEIIDGLEMYTVGRPLKSQVVITVQELQNFIDAIKTLEQYTEWIPVSEEIPNSFEYVLVCTDIGEIALVLFYGTDSKDMTPRFMEEGHWLNGVIAWMPLPKPYKAESEGKE